MGYERYRVEKPVGVNFTMEPSQLGSMIWDSADQVAFRHGTTKKAGGYEQGLGMTPNGIIPESFLPLRDDTDQYYWWAYSTSNPDGTGEIYRIESVDVHRNVTPTAGIPAPTFVGAKWSGDSVNGTPYFTREKPYGWDDAGTFEPLSLFPDHLKAKTIRTYANHMVALNIETERFDPLDYPEGDYYRDFGFWEAGKHQSAIWWSSEIIGKDIDVSWADADPTKESGWNFLGGNGGAIMGGKSLRESFMIYRERSIHQMTYVGGVTVFAFKELFNDVGALGLDCVAEIDGWHMVVGQSDVYMHNGVQKQSIADGIIRKEIFENIDPEHIDKVYIATKYSDKEAWVCIPEGGTNIDGKCNVAYVFNWEEKHWSRRDMPNSLCSSYTILDIAEEDLSWTAPGENAGEVASSWEEAVDTWNSSFWKYNSSSWGLAFGGMDEDGNGAVYTSIEQPLKDGVDYEAVVEKKWIDMEDHGTIKTMNRIFPIVRKGEVDIYVAGTDALVISPKWKYIGRFDPFERNDMGATATGRYMHIKFVIPKTSRAEIKGYWIEYKATGAR